MQDLKRSNNHNLATIEDLLNVLKPIEEADENDQENDSISKHKPRFDRQSKNRRKGRGNNPFKKDGHKHDWKDCPDNKYGNKRHENHQQDRQRDSNQESEIPFEDRHDSNMIEQYESENESDDRRPILEAKYDSDSESESDSEDKESVIETHLLQKKLLKKATKIKRNTIVKASVQLSLEDEEGKKETYLGLLDTRSTGSLMSEELAKRFKLETKNRKITWDTNNGEFKTGKIAVTKNQRFPQFTNKKNGRLQVLR